MYIDCPGRRATRLRVPPGTERPGPSGAAHGAPRVRRCDDSCGGAWAYGGFPGSIPQDARAAKADRGVRTEFI